MASSHWLSSYLWIFPGILDNVIGQVEEGEFPIGRLKKASSHWLSSLPLDISWRSGQRHWPGRGR
jgi:hypothetical protein